MKSLAFTLSMLFSSGLMKAQLLESTAPTNSTLVASSFINDDEGWLADDGGMLWHTTNAGQTWDSMVTENHFVKLNFLDAFNGVALTSGETYKTSDGGHSWTTLPLPENAYGISVCFLNTTAGFIGSHQHIFKTMDGGVTWSATPVENVSIFDFYFVSSLVGVAVGYDEENNRCVWRTSDGGASWTNVFNEENYYMNSVYFISENIGWAAGYYDRAGLKEPSILKSTDGGLTWQENYRYTGISSDGETLTDIRFKNELEGYALSVHNYDLYTLDGGQTWNLVNDSEVISSTPVFGLYKTLGGYSDLYLAGKSGTVTVWK